MSRISELGKNYINLPDILDLYESQLSDITERLDIVGKRLETSSSKTSAWMHYYDQRKAELGTLIKFFKTEEDAIRGRLHKKYKENYTVALGERDISKYIDADAEYLHIHSLLIEVEDVYDQYNVAVKSLIALGYALKSITNARIASLENIEI